MPVPTWFQIFRAESGALDIYKMTPDGKVTGQLLAATHIDRISQFLAGEPTAKTVLVAPADKARPTLAPKEPPMPQGFTRARLAAVARDEAQNGYDWRNKGKAKKYTKKYEPVFGKGRFPWCAAFVTYCCDQIGLNLPVEAPTGYTFALCEAWQIWAQKRGFYHDNDGKFVPAAGDIVLFDWEQQEIHEDDNDWEDHIGIVLSHSGGGVIRTAEGNVDDKCRVDLIRQTQTIQGYIRIPDGYKFPEKV